MLLRNPKDTVKEITMQHFINKNIKHKTELLNFTKEFRNEPEDESLFLKKKVSAVSWRCSTLEGAVTI